jgi:hydrogenase nickel incorporation protein HypA/HybF
MIAEGTIAEGAQLHFQRIPAHLKCKDCGLLYSLAGNQLDACPACESFQVQIITGKEFQLNSIEIENE